MGLAVTIRSQSGNPETCIINCGGSAGDPHRGFLFHRGEGPESRLEGVTVSFGYADLGGGVYLDGSSPTLDTVVFSNNMSSNWGGGAYIYNHSNPVLTNCTSIGNFADNYGAGAMVQASSSPSFTDCAFVGNSSNYHGGGLYVNNYSDGSLTSCTFYGNAAAACGAGIGFGGHSGGTLHQCLFHDNTASTSIDGGGGGLFCHGYCTPTITSCTFSGNSGVSGGGAFIRHYSTPVFENTIIAFSSQGCAISCASDSDVTLSCSDVYGNAGGDYVDVLDGLNGVDGNFSEDPLFCDAAGDDFTLRDNSPCAGENNPACGQVGAFGVGCSAGATTYVVKADGSGAFPTIQDAVTASADGDTIELADGTFVGDGNRDIDFLGRAVTLRSQSGDAGACVIDCGGSESDPHKAFFLDSGEGQNAVLEGLTITHAYGSAVLISGTTPTIRECVFEDNHGVNAGAISVTAGADPVISRCRFVANNVTNAGGACVVGGGASGTFVDCEFIDNFAYWGGGAVYTNEGAPELNGCVFAGNTSSAMGGALHCKYAGGSAIVRNCTFYSNGAHEGGAVYARLGAIPTIENSILAFSSESVAVFCSGEAGVTLVCSDVYGNAGGDYVGCLGGMNGVDGNFSADPLFCDAEAENVNLNENSPCSPDHSGGCGLIGARPVGCGRKFRVTDDGSGDYPTI